MVKLNASYKMKTNEPLQYGAHYDFREKIVIVPKKNVYIHALQLITMSWKLN